MLRSREPTNWRRSYTSACGSPRIVRTSNSLRRIDSERESHHDSAANGAVSAAVTCAKRDSLVRHGEGMIVVGCGPESIPTGHYGWRTSRFSDGEGELRLQSQPALSELPFGAPPGCSSAARRKAPAMFPEVMHVGHH